MYTRAIVKGLVLPSISVGVVRAEGKENECDNTKKLVRPRDLALYVDPPKCVSCSNTVETEDGVLLTTIRCARQELQSVFEQARTIQAEATALVNQVKKETSDAVSYLQQDENLLPRMGAIGFGAFAGYILAVRKGILKKMIYSAAGAGAIAAIAYPNEAREVSEEVMCELKKYAVIGYHFVNGADVDWKKLNEKMHCFEKNMISGGRFEMGTSGRSLNARNNRDVALVEPEGGANDEDPSRPDSNSAGGSSKKSSRPPNAPGDKDNLHQSSNHKQCRTEVPLPQERPSPPVTTRQYQSYSEECKAKKACLKKHSPSNSEEQRKGLTQETAKFPNGECVLHQSRPTQSASIRGGTSDRKPIPNDSEGVQRPFSSEQNGLEQPSTRCKRADNGTGAQTQHSGTSALLSQMPPQSDVQCRRMQEYPDNRSNSLRSPQEPVQENQQFPPQSSHQPSTSCHQDLPQSPRRCSPPSHGLPGQAPPCPYQGRSRDSESRTSVSPRPPPNEKRLVQGDSPLTSESPQCTQPCPALVPRCRAQGSPPKAQHSSGSPSPMQTQQRSFNDVTITLELPYASQNGSNPTINSQLQKPNKDHRQTVEVCTQEHCLRRSKPKAVTEVS